MCGIDPLVHANCPAKKTLEAALAENLTVSEVKKIAEGYAQDDVGSVCDRIARPPIGRADEIIDEYQQTLKEVRESK
jgi:hypothetical protein